MIINEMYDDINIYRVFESILNAKLNQTHLSIREII